MLTKLHDAKYKLILPIGLGVIIALILFTSILSVSKINSITKQMINTNKQNAAKIALIDKMTEFSLDRASLLQTIIHRNNPTKRTLALNSKEQLINAYQHAREQLSKHNLNEEQRIILAQQKSLDKQISDYESAIYDLLIHNNTTEAQNKYFTSPLLTYEFEHLIALEQLINIEHKLRKAAFIKLKKANNTTLQQVGISMCIVFLIAILLASFVIISQKISRLKLTELANSDVLTGLPNRKNLIQNVEKILHESPENTFAIVFLDIDYFKSINDNYGHDVGDEILKKFSKKIEQIIAPDDILSRFGGDEFVILLNSVDTKTKAIALVHTLSKALDTSFNINNKEVFTSSSIGATVYAQASDCTDAKKLLNQADNAMYVAKESGRNCFKFFSENNHKKMQREHAIEHALHTIVKNKNRNHFLFMKYQPLYDLRNNKIAGYEALIRWGDDDRIIIPTSEFIRIAEKTTLIEKVNLLVIKEVCKQKALWNKANVNPYVKINFNLCGNKKSFDFLLNIFSQEMLKYGLKPYEFGLELTERTIMEVSEDTVETMKKLKKKGLKISIDDFGTGYSSLSYLKKLPITTIKIDKSFITGLPFDKDDIELVKTIITLGKSFKLDIIAEGVETEKQLQFLRDHSCKLAQGYLLNKPLNAKEISQFKSSDYQTAQQASMAS